MKEVKTKEEIEILKIGGKKLAHIRDRLLTEIRVGAVPLEIDHLAKQLIGEAGGAPSFTTVKDYRWATCICINDVVVHGVPTHDPFKAGDVVGLDVGLLYKGFHTDTSWTILVQNSGEARSRFARQKEIENFLKTGEEGLKKAIGEAKVGNRIGHISQAIQARIEGAHYSVVRSLVGHGIGRALHEPPQVPGVLTKDIVQTLPLKEGMVLAIEVIYTMGKPEIVHKNDDGWTLVTADGSISGLFEQTVAICDKGPVILTQSS